MKLNANIAKLEMIQTELNQWGPSSSQPSKLSKELIEKNEANVSIDFFLSNSKSSGNDNELKGKG